MTSIERAKDAPRILVSGDSAVTVEFGATIDAALNARVLGLDQAVTAARLPFINETVPTYRSLIVHYDPVAIKFDAIAALMLDMAAKTGSAPSSTRHWRFPVVYGGAFGIDLEEVAIHAKLTPEEVVAIHSGATYRVYMVGFTPGYSYLGGLDPRIATPRRKDPRFETPAGTVAIGGEQTGVQCLAAPSGWNLLGRTPARTFHPHREPMFLLEPGDTVSFEPIDAARWDELDRRRCGWRANRRAVSVMSRLSIDGISPASSVQDFGRFGAQRFGLTSSGAMDCLSLAVANILVGQPTHAAAMEIGPLPSRLTAKQGPLRIACAGAMRTLSIGDRAIEMNQSALLGEGETLVISAARPGVFSYLAIEGGIIGEPSFGSLSVTARAGIGSPYPRPLQAGDEIEVRTADSGRTEQRIELDPMPKGPISVVLGPQDDYFSDEQIETFFAADWSVSLASDRMGYRLDGPPIQHAKGFNIISDGIVNGHIQIPGNGLPLVLLADRGTTGGYPKIGAIITADLGRFAQIEVGGTLRFRKVGIEEAQAEAVRFATLITGLADRVVPVRSIPTIEELLSSNLAGGVVQALDGASWGGFHSTESGLSV